MSRPEEVAARFNDRITARDPVGLAGSALWRATVDGEQVSRWQVYDDTAANRKHLRL